LVYATNIKNIFSVSIYFGAEGRLQLFCKPLVLAAACGACKCAAMWDSQNAFGEKCGGVKI